MPNASLREEGGEEGEDMDLGLLAEVTRGALVESRHLGRVIIVNKKGEILFNVGAPESLIFPRSTVKAFFALELIRSGAADRLNITEEMLALICSSHNGEEAHIQCVEEILKRASYEEAHLECGAHWPTYRPAADRLLKFGCEEPSQLYNTCSAKHALILCLARDQKIDPTGYVMPTHPLQKRMTALLEEVTGAEHLEEQRGIDGCSFPTYAIEIQKLAHGFARFATGEGLGEELAFAAKRLRKAIAAYPFMVAGTNRFETVLMAHFGEKIFLKMGAEGLMAASLPEEGLGIIIKAEDGAARAAEVAMAGILLEFTQGTLVKTEEDVLILQQWAQQPLVNWHGHEIGMLKAAF